MGHLYHGELLVITRGYIEQILVGGLEHFYTLFIFPYIGNDNPN